MQSQLSLFWYLSFHRCSNGCFSITHNVNDPIVWNGSPLWAEQSWTGSQERTWAYLELQAVLLRHASLWVWFLTSRGRHCTTDGFLSLLAPAVRSEACHTEAKMGPDSHLSHSQQTIKHINWKATSGNRSTSSTHPLLQILIALIQTTITGHAYHHTSRGRRRLWPRRRAGRPRISSVLFFMLSLLKAFS